MSTPGSRWVLKSSTGKVYAQLDAGMVSSQMASAFGQLIADKTMIPLVLRIVHGPIKNPTLVHHGVAQRSQWHVTGPHDQPIADLYFGDTGTAKSVGQSLSDLLAMPIRLYKNTEHGSPPLHEHSRTTVVGMKTALRRNPGGPLPGQVWKRRGGGSVKIRSAGGGRVEVLNTETGNREWIDHEDFLASHTLHARRNPPRRPRKVRRAVASGRSPKARHYAQASVARGVRRLDTQRRTDFKVGRGKANPKGRKQPKYIAWVHHSSVAVGDTIEAVVERARALVHSARWQKFEPGYPEIYVTTYGAQKMVQRGISSAEPPVGPVANRRRRKRALSPKRTFTSGRAKPRGRVRPRTRSNPNMRVMYSPANRAWVWTFGDSLLRPAPDLPIFWDRRADLVSALDALGIQTDKRGVTTSKPGMRENPLPRWVDKRSIRTVGRGGSRVLVGCPKGKWSSARRRCRVGTRKVEKVGRRKARANPRDSALTRARRTFTRLNEIEPGKITKVKTTKGAPKVLAKIGELVSIRYRSDKYAGSKDNPHGKTLLYEHETKRPRPVLATDPSGREVHIVGGRMHPTPDGLVN